jgi:hypothetical protein
MLQGLTHWSPRQSWGEQKASGFVSVEQPPTQVPLQLLLWHSLFPEQVAPGQSKHDPPQSTPVSSPFCAPSKQLGTSQIKPVQTPL